MCVKNNKQKHLVITVVISSFILIALAILVAYQASKAVDISIEHDTVISQVVDDWSVKPWTQIRVSNAQCDLERDDTEPLFYQNWSGTKDGCKVLDRDGEWRIITREQAEMEGKKTCVYIEAEPGR